MTLLLAAVILTLTVPLLFGSWRMAVGGLGAQAVVIALLFGRHLHGPSPGVSAGAAVLLLDVVVVRGLLLPWLLWRTRAGAPTRLDVLPGNLLHWGIAALLATLAASFAARVVPAGAVTEAVHVGTSAAQVLLGLFVLCCHRSALGQAIGALTVENGVLLFEAGARAHLPAPAQAGVSAVFLGFLLLTASMVRAEADRDAAPATAPAPGEELL